MKALSIATVSLCLFGALACADNAKAPAPAPDKPAVRAPDKPIEPMPAPDPRVEQARAALLPLKKELKAALTKALPEGPDKAIDACHAAAPTVTAAASAGAIKVGRTSHRLRNEQNAPADWMKPLLDQLVAKPDTPFASAALPDGSLGYLEPIVTQPPCLACHGAELSDAVKAKLDAKYPKDAARGFKAGELRGAFWAVVPKAAS
jgi:hypothetical protein